MGMWLAARSTIRKKRGVRLKGLAAPAVAACLGLFTAFLVQGLPQTALLAPHAGHDASADWWGHWAEEKIVYGFHKGIVTGCPDGTFRPGATCSRAELVVLLLRVLGEEEEATAMKRLPSRFSDVPVSHWAHGYLELAYTWGLVAPDDERRILPEFPVTRAEMATVVWKAVRRFGLEGVNGLGQLPPFVDSGQIPVEALEAVVCLHALGVVTGDDRGAFRPNALVTRAEVLVMCVRVLGALGNLWDIEGEVVCVDHKNETLTVDTGVEQVSLRYREDSIAVYQNSRRLPVDAIAAGSRVGVLFKEGAFPTLSYVLVISG
ncbi:MAG: S-layer homology domain-containing protein [Firmicutes bacterium]|nr:S-layer homology domain-containing protein [Candidatus Fermentithermobacillaceae bacterium]